MKVIPTEKLASLLECPICQETFKDPRALPCLHTYCLECIKPLYEPGIPFPCPYCRQEFLFVSPLEEVLPCDLRINAILDMKPIEFSSTKHCTSCQKRQSIGICMHCGKHCCVECIEDHEKKVVSQVGNVVTELCSSIKEFEDIQDKVISSIRINCDAVRSVILEECKRILECVENAKTELLSEVEKFEKRAKTKVERAHNEVLPQINHIRDYVKINNNCGITSTKGTQHAIASLKQGKKLLDYINSIRNNLDMDCLIAAVPKLYFDRNQYLQDYTTVGKLYLRFPESSKYLHSKTISGNEYSAFRRSHTSRSQALSMPKHKENCQNGYCESTGHISALKNKYVKSTK